MATNKSKYPILFIVLLATTFVSGCNIQDRVKMSKSISSNKNIVWKSPQRKTSVPFKLFGDQIIIPVSINGSAPRDFLFDTGAAVTTIFEHENSNDLGLTTSGSVNLGGAGKGAEHESFFSHGVSLTIGDITMLERSVFYSPLESSPFYDSIDEAYLAGAIGAELLNKYVIEVNYDSMTINISEGGEFEEPKDKQWVSMPIELKYGLLFSQSNVSVSGDTTALRELTFLLDTGAGLEVLLVPDSHQQISFPEYYYESGSGKGTAGDFQLKTAQIESFELGQFELENFIGVFSNDVPSIPLKSYNGIVGNQFLSRFNTIFDYANETMWLQKNQRFNRPSLPSRSDIQISLHRLGYIVKTTNQTHQNTSLLREGDIITKFDQHSAHKENLELMRDVLSSSSDYVSICWINGESTEERCGKLPLKDAQLHTDSHGI